MSWSVRHEGSPLSIDGLNTAQVIEGLQDGLWDPTDEVRAPTDAEWTAIENHPKFAEIAADLESPPAKYHPDETRLDMNPLIDVALVLLIFFILTTSYAAIQKVLQLPETTTKGVKGVPTYTTQRIREFTIKVEAKMEGDKPVILVENEPVEVKYLVPALRRYVRDTSKTTISINAQGVNWGTVVAIQDAAKGAGVQQAYLVLPKGTRR
jgi:biopolymer transport protein ExbD